MEYKDIALRNDDDDDDKKLRIVIYEGKVTSAIVTSEDSIITILLSLQRAITGKNSMNINTSLTLTIKLNNFENLSIYGYTARLFRVKFTHLNYKALILQVKN